MTEDTDKTATGPGPMAAVAGVAALGAALAILGSLPSAFLWVGVAGAAAAVWFLHDSLYRWLTCLPFAASLLGALLLFTALGTFIPQGLAKEALAEKYGEGLGDFIDGAGLDDLFHTFTFRGLLGTLALSMILVIVKRRAWRFPEWGPFLAHSGIVVVLAGGLAWNLRGAKGFIDLQEGRTALTMEGRDLHGRPTGKTMELGFGVRLDRFELERYPEEFRLYVYRKKGEKWNILSSTGIKDASKWIRASGTDRSFRILQAFPDFEIRSEIKEKTGGGGIPALLLRVLEPDGKGVPVTLLAGKKDREEIRIEKERAAVRFVWTGDPAASRWTEPVAEKHVLVLRKDPAVPPEEVPVRPGGKYPLGGGEVEVLEYFPDFIYDTRARRGATRSDQPRNPALRVAVRDAPAGPAEERWLFANNPDFGRAHGREGSDLRYVYTPAHDPPEREVVVVGKTREVAEYRRGVPQGRTPLRTGGESPLLRGVEVERLIESAEETFHNSTRSAEWRRPAAEVEVRGGGQTARTLLPAGEPLELGSPGTALVFEKKSDDIRAFRSRVSILEGGAAVRQETLSVNHPLAHKGHWLYQSNYRPEDPTYSGILVMRDPGLGIVYTGFAMISLGVILSFYVRPRLRRTAAGKATS
jgi:hypothetical protein